MSADLFAAFNAPVQEAPAQKQQGTASNAPSTSNGSDPFAFLASGNTMQQKQQHQQQWQPSPAPQQQQHQQQQAFQPSSLWPVAQPSRPSSDTWGQSAASTTPSSVIVNARDQDQDDEDGWGDFEVAAPETMAPVPAPAPNYTSVPVPAFSLSTVATHSAAAPGPRPGPSPMTRVRRADTLDIMMNNLINVDTSPSKPEPWQERPSWEASAKTKSQPKKHQNPDPNVLFDADDFDGEAPPEEDDDDFGDFEAMPTSTLPNPNPPPPKSALDLLAEDFGQNTTKPRQGPPGKLLSTWTLQESTSPYPQAPVSPSFQERNPFPGLGVATPKASEFPQEVTADSPSPVTAWPTYDDEKKDPDNSFDESWGDFEDRPPAPSSSHAPAKPKADAAKGTGRKPKSTPTATASSDWDWDAWEGNDSKGPGLTPAAPATAPSVAPSTAPLADRDTGGPPPINVPPPSLLLSLFPDLLGLANASLFKPLSSQPASVKDRVLVDPSTISFLRGYLALATVAARVIAGRKLRWHRDKFLSQGMAISAAGGKGGMKLSGIDKSQSRSEDREAADVVSVWKEHVGRLRSAVAAVNSALPNEPPLRVPDLMETVAVQTVKGALTAPKPCIICGLKREERLPKADFSVEDSFGEWWVDHWGHRACRNFWLEYETKLRQR